jgi:hypothetical protein
MRNVRRTWLRAPRLLALLAFDDVAFNIGRIRPAVPGAYLITGPEFEARTRVT